MRFRVLTIFFFNDKGKRPHVTTANWRHHGESWAQHFADQHLGNWLLQRRHHFEHACSEHVRIVRNVSAGFQYAFANHHVCGAAGVG